MPFTFVLHKKTIDSSCILHGGKKLVGYTCNKCFVRFKRSVDVWNRDGTHQLWMPRHESRNVLCIRRLSNHVRNIEREEITGL